MTRAPWPGAVGGRAFPRRALAGGATLLEALASLAVLGALLTLAAGAATPSTERAEALASARALASDLKLHRATALAEGVTLGLEISRPAEGGDWRLRLIEDGDGDGIRRADVDSGRDRIRSGPEALSQRCGDLRPGFLPTLEVLRSPPPSPRPLGALLDPVRFGASDVITFTARGPVTSGTLYLTDGRAVQLALVVHGASARVRLFELDPLTLRWALR